MFLSIVGRGRKEFGCFFTGGRFLLVVGCFVGTGFRICIGFAFEGFGGLFVFRVFRRRCRGFLIVCRFYFLAVGLGVFRFRSRSLLWLSGLFKVICLEFGCFFGVFLFVDLVCVF